MSVAQQGLQHSYWTGPGLDIQEESRVRGNVFLNNSCWFAFSFSTGCMAQPQNNASAPGELLADGRHQPGTLPAKDRKLYT